MRILHVTHGIGGGAGRAVLRINEACQAAGLTSAVLNIAQAPERDGVFQAVRSKIRSAGECMDHYFTPDYIELMSKGNSNTLFSVAYPAVDLLNHPLVQRADIVNLHWVTWVFAPHDIRTLAQEKPVVWTFHDYWPVTGGCHYPSGCKQYESECFSCPQLNDRIGIVPAGFLDKRLNFAGLPGLHPIAPSGYLAEAISKSRVFADKPPVDIANPIDLSAFAPVEDRARKRAALGIEDDECVLVFGNYYNDELRKGGRILREALEQLLDREKLGGRKFAIITFGTGYKLPASDRIKTLTFSTIHDDSMLRDILGIADVQCFPSLEDNYPNAIIEAAGCGTPTIAFRTGGMAEMVLDGETGLLVDAIGAPDAFADAIRQFHDQCLGDTAMRERTRAQAESTNSLTVVGSRYRAFYQSLLAGTHGPKAPARAWAGLPAPTPERDRFLKTLSASMTERMGESFWTFALQAELEEHMDWGDRLNPRQHYKHWGRPELVPAPWPEGRKKLLLIATHHDHHAAHSGPLQYARHLDRTRLEWRHLRVPLGDGLVDEIAGFDPVRQQLRDWGLPILASQPNALMAEMHVTQTLIKNPHAVDLVHYIDGDHSGWLAPLALRALGVTAPRFATSFHQPPDAMKGAISPALLVGFDRIFLMAENQRDAFAGLTAAPDADITPHGVDTGYYCPAGAGDAAAGAGKARRLLSVGHWLRDYPAAFEAVETLRRRGLDIEYRIVGAPASLAYPPYVTILNGLTDDELKAEYQAADIFFMPLVKSTANNALLEAMASGLPIVTTDTGGVPAMTGRDAAHLCPPGDAAGYADTLLALLEDDGQRSALGARARAKAQSFDWSHIGTLMSDHYGRLLEEELSRSRAGTARALPWRTEVCDGNPHAALVAEINRLADAGEPLGADIRDTAGQVLLGNHSALQDAGKYPILLALSRHGSLVPCG